MRAGALAGWLMDVAECVAMVLPGGECSLTGGSSQQAASGRTEGKSRVVLAVSVCVWKEGVV